MNFQWNPGVEDEIDLMSVAAVQERFQPVLDSVHDEYAGQPTDTIKPVLKARWEADNDGASITDPELTDVAQAISIGLRVIMRDGRIEST